MTKQQITASLSKTLLQKNSRLLVNLLLFIYFLLYFILSESYFKNICIEHVSYAYDKVRKTVIDRSNVLSRYNASKKIMILVDKYDVCERRLLLKHLLVKLIFYFYSCYNLY